MSLLYDRLWQVIITAEGDSRSWGRVSTDQIGIDIAGDVTKTSDGDPNELNLKIFNLNESSRKFINRKGMTVEVKAGYPGDLFGTIYKGTLEIPNHYRDGVDRVTELKAKDGAFLLRNIHISKSFKKDTDVEKILEDIVSSLTDNVVPAASLSAVAGLQRGTAKIIITGKKTKKTKVILGPARTELENIIKSYNLILRITDQEININSPGESLNVNTILLNSNSGLLDVPEPLDEDNGYKFKSLLRHEFNPGIHVTVNSGTIKGVYAIDEVKHSFDSRGSNWYSEIEARPV